MTDAVSINNPINYMATVGNIIAGGNLVAASGNASVSTTTGALVVRGGAGISGNLNVGGSINVNGTVTGITASMVGLGNVTNESKATILTNAALTGIPTAPTAATGTNTTQLATTAFVQQNAVPSGAVFYFAAATAPSGYLVCNGALLSTSEYAALFAVIGYTYGGSAGNFNLPDLRGEFIRGWDSGRGIDSSRGFGSSQLDQFQNHGHRNFSAGNTPTNGGSFNRSGDTQPGTGIFNDVSIGPAIAGPTNPGGTPRAGLETRPRNVALLPCIKI
jgi:hypothetical protein